MSEIRVEAYPVAGTWGAGHLYLVYVDDNGDEFVIRGGPRNGVADVINPLGTIGLEIDVPMTNDGLPEHRSKAERASRGSVVIDLGDDGPSADVAWKQLAGMARLIENAGLSYDADPYGDAGVNSNSLVVSLLGSIGVDINDVWPNNPDGIDPHNFGSDDDPHPEYPGAFAGGRLTFQLQKHLARNLSIKEINGLKGRVPDRLITNIESMIENGDFDPTLPDPALKPGAVVEKLKKNGFYGESARVTPRPIDDRAW